MPRRLQQPGRLQHNRRNSWASLVPPRFNQRQQLQRRQQMPRQRYQRRRRLQRKGWWRRHDSSVPRAGWVGLVPAASCGLNSWPRPRKQYVLPPHVLAVRHCAMAGNPRPLHIRSRRCVLHRRRSSCLRCRAGDLPHACSSTAAQMAAAAAAARRSGPAAETAHRRSSAGRGRRCRCHCRLCDHLATPAAWCEARACVWAPLARRQQQRRQQQTLLLSLQSPRRHGSSSSSFRSSRRQRAAQAGQQGRRQPWRALRRRRSGCAASWQQLSGVLSWHPQQKQPLHGSPSSWQLLQRTCSVWCWRL